MNILHIVASLQTASGGPALSVSRVAAEQARRGHNVTVLAFDEHHLGAPLPTGGARRTLVPSDDISANGRGWSARFRRAAMDEAAKAHLVHNHGLWMWPNAYAREAAVAAGKPLIISPRGMLEAWSLGRSKLRKAVAWWLFEKKNLQSAAMFHATAESEAESIRDAVKRLRDEKTKREKGEGGAPIIVVAPNGVDLPDVVRGPRREVLEANFPQLKDRRWVVFMSRLHPKKGVDVLLRAWRKQQNVERGPSSMEQGVGEETAGRRHDSAGTKRPTDRKAMGAPILVLAGPDLIGYRKDVELMIKELRLEGSVVMTGEVLGKEKDCLLANADVFVLPSYSENFGIVVAEAMAWGCPVVASTATPWREIKEKGAGWWVDPTEDELTYALAEALGLDAKQAAEKGEAGRNLVESNYSWEQAAERLLEGYRNIVNP